MKIEEFRYVDQKKLRCGYTTGSCAAAAAKAAVKILLSGTFIKTVSLMTPKQIALHLPVEKIEKSKETVTCAIQKDAGDDADVTDGIYIYATVKKQKTGITIDGGEGVGRVTKPGLNQPVGAAAINSVPRSMISSAIEEVCEEEGYCGGIEVIISAPEGISLAKKTFNPRLGILGGISILGTSGIVEPMSEAALLETIRLDMNMQKKAGKQYIILTPGNYGEKFIRESYGLSLEDSVKCSNFIGQSLDMACELRFKGILLVGHIGKLVKLGAGIMNTHSKWADGRMETLITCALLAGADTKTLLDLTKCVTTEDCLVLLKEKNLLSQTMQQLMKKIEEHVGHRVPEGMVTGVVTFSSTMGLLGETRHVTFLRKKLEVYQ